MRTPLPPIARAANRALLDIERAVRRFPRYHKYQVGADLRAQAMTVARGVYRAWRERSRQLQRIHELAAAIDDLKLTVQLAKQVHAYGSFGDFEVVARQVSDLGRQCGGWLKSLHTKSQNGADGVQPQRALILSSRDASQGAAL